MIYALYLLVLLFFISSLWTLVSVSKSSARFLWIYIPLNISVAAASIFVYNTILGDPTTRSVPEQFNLIYFYVDEPKAIYLWIRTPDRPAPYYHVRPYSKEEHKQLMQMTEKAKQGVVKGEKKKGTKKTGSPEESNSDIIRYYDFTKELTFPQKEK